MLMRYTLPSRKLMVAAAVVALAAGWLTKFSRARRREAHPRTQPRHLQTWEGEGGGIPADAGRTVAQTPAATSADTAPLAPASAP